MSENKLTRTSKSAMDRELLARIDERQKNMNETFTKKLGEIHDEVKKTNGRVTSLENWRSRVGGSWKAVVAMSAVISVVIGWLLHVLL